MNYVKIMYKVKEFALEYDIPIRIIEEISRDEFSGLKTTEGYIAGFYGEMEL